VTVPLHTRPDQPAAAAAADGGETSPPPVRSRPYLRPAPVSEPPYDDELVDGGPGRRVYPLWLVPRHRGLGLHLDREPADVPVPEELPFEESVPPAPAPRLYDLSTFERQPTSRSGLPEPGPVAAALVRAMLEVFAGRRPVQQLMGRTSDAVYANLLARAGRRRGRYAAARDPFTGSAGQRPSGPAPAGAPAGCAAGVPRLSSVRVSEPADGVAEVSAVVRHGERARAVALRLEGMDGRWRCTALSVV